MLACDFLTVDIVFLRRLYVLVFISIGSRRIEYVACTANPDGAWMLQQTRNLLMDLDDRGQQPRFLNHDRDAKFSLSFDALFRCVGIQTIRTPVKAPKANAYIERWVGTLRRGVPRPAADPQPPPPRASPRRLYPPLQRREAAPRTRAST